MDKPLVEKNGKEEFSFHLSGKRSSIEDQQTEKYDSKKTPDLSQHRIMSFQHPSNSVTSTSMQFNLQKGMQALPEMLFQNDSNSKIQQS